MAEEKLYYPKTKKGYTHRLQEMKQRGEKSHAYRLRLFDGRHYRSGRYGCDLGRRFCIERDGRQCHHAANYVDQMIYHGKSVMKA